MFWVRFTVKALCFRYQLVTSIQTFQVNFLSEFNLTFMTLHSI